MGLQLCIELETGIDPLVYGEQGWSYASEPLDWPGLYGVSRLMTEAVNNAPDTSEHGGPPGVLERRVSGYLTVGSYRVEVFRLACDLKGNVLSDSDDMAGAVYPSDMPHHVRCLSATPYLVVGPGQAWVTWRASDEAAQELKPDNDRYEMPAELRTSTQHLPFLWFDLHSGEAERVVCAFEPDEPGCGDGDEPHVWRLVGADDIADDGGDGGLAERRVECCRLCGCYRETVEWPGADGEILTRTAYGAPDAVSMVENEYAWLQEKDGPYPHGETRDAGRPGFRKSLPRSDVTGRDGTCPLSVQGFDSGTNLNRITGMGRRGSLSPMKSALSVQSPPSASRSDSGMSQRGSR